MTYFSFEVYAQKSFSWENMEKKNKRNNFMKAWVEKNKRSVLLVDLQLADGKNIEKEIFYINLLMTCCFLKIIDL